MDSMRYNVSGCDQASRVGGGSRVWSDLHSCFEDGSRHHRSIGERAGSIRLEESTSGRSSWARSRSAYGERLVTVTW